MDEEALKPLHSKDMKPPPEYSGGKKYFLAWHESFTSMMRMKTARWLKLVEWIKSRRKKRIPISGGKAEYGKLEPAGYAQHALFDLYIFDNFDAFQGHLYRYLLDYTKDKARMDVLANKEGGAFEAYRFLVHKALGINDERALDVEAQVLNPRKAKSEKDVTAAFQELKNHKMWLVEAAYTHTYDILRRHDGKMAVTILVKMMPTDGRYSLQKYLRDLFSKNLSYEALEEELLAELHRTEADGDKGGDAKAIHQITKEILEGEKEKVAEEEWIEKTVWNDDWGWIQALTPSPKRVRTDDETPQNCVSRPKAKERVEQGVRLEGAGSVEVQTTTTRLPSKGQRQRREHADARRAGVMAARFVAWTCGDSVESLDAQRKEWRQRCEGQRWKRTRRKRYRWQRWNG